jgi:alpha-ketoglutarate-dependent taurine dioxygenase
MEIASFDHSNFSGTMKERKGEIAQAFDTHGAVLLRGGSFDLQMFETLSRGLCQGFHNVAIRQPLRQKQGDGFSTEVFRGNFVLLGHSEGCYHPYPKPPDVCFFLCITPPEAAGGETTLVDAAAMVQAMPSALRQQLEKYGIIYECQWKPKRWQDEFGVVTECELRQLLETLSGVEYTLHDGVLHLFYSTAAIVTTRAGVPVFANGILAHLPRINHPRYEGRTVFTKESNRVYFGNGDPFDDGDINALIDAHDKVLYAHRWAAHDLLIIDNYRFLHGRNMTDSPCERVIASRFGWLEGEMSSVVHRQESTPSIRPSPRYS